MRILCIFGLAFLLCNCSRSVVVNSPKTNTPRSLKFDWNSTNQLAQLESVSSAVTSVNPAMVAEELNASKWDYKTELVLISCLAVLSIPANLFLIVFYTKKMRHFKKRKHFNLRYASIANSFHSYLIEICSFDTVNVVYLILNSTFHFLYFLEKSEYESVFDISNFACKFFIYILRISAAMSNYLVFLLSLNRLGHFISLPLPSESRNLTTNRLFKVFSSHIPSQRGRNKFAPPLPQHQILDLVSILSVHNRQCVPSRTPLPKFGLTR